MARENLPARLHAWATWQAPGLLVSDVSRVR